MHVRDGHASALIADDRGGNARRYRFGVAQKPLILPHLRQGDTKRNPSSAGAAFCEPSVAADYAYRLVATQLNKKERCSAQV
jgi:hypothetical protein